MSYPSPKAKDYGVNLCDGCLEKQREIDRLRQEVLALKQKLSYNQRKSTEGFFGLSTPSSKVPVKANSLEENQEKKGGARVGHKGVGRKVFSRHQADEIRLAESQESECEECLCPLVVDKNDVRSVYDLQRLQVRKIAYEVERKHCPKCRKRYRGRVENALERSSLSNDLVVEVAHKHYGCGNSLGQIAGELGINHSTLLESLKRVGKKLEPGLEKLKADYRLDEVRHADETPWRTDGGNGYSWYFGSPRVSLHLFRQTRSATVVKEVFGSSALEGCLVVDRYSGYHRVPCRMQYCYAHLLRDLKGLEEEFLNDEEVKNYTQAMKIHLIDAMQLRKRDLSDEEYYLKAAEIKAQIIKLSEAPAKHLGVRKWQDFYVEKAARLYQWSADRRIPAENNYAEREIRKTVIARKISYGSQSEKGAKTREIWTSVLESLKKREADPREKLVSALNKLNDDNELNLAQELFG